MQPHEHAKDLESLKSTLKYGFFGLLAFFVVWLIVVVVWNALAPRSGGFEAAANLGNAMSFFGALATVAAFAASAYALILQRQDIKTQVDQFAAQIEEGQRLAKEQEQQEQRHQWEIAIAQIDRLRNEIEADVRHASEDARHRQSMVAHFSSANSLSQDGAQLKRFAEGTDKSALALSQRISNEAFNSMEKLVGLKAAAVDGFLQRQTLTLSQVMVVTVEIAKLWTSFVATERKLLLPNG